MSSGGIPLTATSVVRAGEAYSVESLNRLATQHRELEAIVRDLAASNPAPDYWCFICGHERGNHAPVCAFGRAREWVERHA